MAFFSFAAAVDSAPLSFFKEGEAEGFEPELIAALGRKSAFESSVVLGDWPTLVKSVGRGDLDAICGMEKSVGGDSRLAFSIPYFVDQYVIYARPKGRIRDAADLASARIAVMAGNSVISSYLVPNGLSDHLVETASFHEAFRMACSGQADCAIAPRVLGNFALKEEGEDGLVEVGRSLCPAEYRFGVRADNAALLALLNDGIMALARDGGMDSLYGAWKLGGDRAFPLAQGQAGFHAFALALVLVLALALAALLVLSRIACNRERRKLREANAFLVQVLDALPFGLCWKDRGRKPVGENRAWRESGPSPEAGSQADHMAERAALAGEARSLRLETASSSLLSSRLPIKDGSGAIIGVLRVDDDRGEERRLQEAVRHLTNDLARERLRRARAEILDEQSGCFCRSYLQARLEAEMVSYDRNGTVFSVLAMSARALVTHEACRAPGFEDASIKKAAGAALSRLRPSDIAGRFSSTLFLFLLPRTGGEKAEEMADSMERSLDAEIVMGQRIGDLLSIGVAEYAGQGLAEYMDALVECIASRAAFGQGEALGRPW